MPIDPITGAILGAIGKALVANEIEGHTCDVCRQLKPFSSWTRWTCCYKAQCDQCASFTRNRKKCHNCGTQVQ